MNCYPSQIDFIPVVNENRESYVKLGIRSYEQHYLHLWQNSDPSPYLSNNFTDDIISDELQNDELRHFIVRFNTQPAGIFKLVLNAAVGDYDAAQALLIEKIYLLAEYSGQGIGKACLHFVLKYAGELDKRVIWLDTMKNGRALDFYLDFGFKIIGEKDLSYPNVLDEQKPMFVLSYEL